MESSKIILEFDQKHREFKNHQIILTKNVELIEINQSVVDLYENNSKYPSLMPHLDIRINGTDKAILIKSWGYQLSSLSQFQIQSYCKETWLQNILIAYISMRPFSPKLTDIDIYIENNEEPRFLPITSVSEEEYLQNFKNTMQKMFGHNNSIIERSKKIKTFSEVEEWLRDLRPNKEGKSIVQLVELKNELPKNMLEYRIPLTEEQKEWIVSFTGSKPGTKMQMTYDGQKNHFQPSPLIQVAKKNQLLFLVQTTNNKRIAFWMATKPDILPNSTFGTYYGDKTSKSVLLGLEKRSVHHLLQENFAVGFGDQILVSIGKLDLVFSAFNCENLSYFPCSYGEDEEKGVKCAQELLGKTFRLKQMQVYRLNEQSKLKEVK